MCAHARTRCMLQGKSFLFHDAKPSNKTHRATHGQKWPHRRRQGHGPLQSPSRQAGFGPREREQAIPQEPGVNPSSYSKIQNCKYVLLYCQSTVTRRKVPAGRGASHLPGRPCPLHNGLLQRGLNRRQSRGRPTETHKAPRNSPPETRRSGRCWGVACVRSRRTAAGWTRVVRSAEAARGLSPDASWHIL